MRTTTEMHRRKSSTVRISVDGLLDDDERSYSGISTPRSTQALFEKHRTEGYDSIKATSPSLGSPSPNLLSWKSPRARQPRTWLRLARRSAFLAVAGFFVYVLVASRGTYAKDSVAHLKHYITRDGTARRPLRTDHTYAYGTPLPNESNAYDEHPVHGLIREAKEQWNQKVARQSKTYYEAVREYQRRNRRDPPPGFKEWYRWAREHNVQLIDEFDTISNQIEPFLSLRPSVVRQRIAEHEDLTGWGTNFGLIYINDGRLEIGGATWRPPVPEGFVSLMEPLAHLLPDVTVPLHLHDGPCTAQSFDVMQAYRQAAQEGRWVKEDELNLHGDNTSVVFLRSVSPFGQKLTFPTLQIVSNSVAVRCPVSLPSTCRWSRCADSACRAGLHSRSQQRHVVLYGSGELGASRCQRRRPWNRRAPPIFLSLQDRDEWGLGAFTLFHSAVPCGKLMRKTLLNRSGPRRSCTT